MTRSQPAPGLRSRLFYGLLSNSFGKLATTASQLIGVPIFLHFWGVRLYGDWLLLNAIPVYLNLSDMGFGSAAGNQMTILEAQGKRSEVIETFQSIWLLITVTSGIAGLIAFLTVPLIPLKRWLHLTELSSGEVTAITLLLAGSVVLGMQEQLFQCAFRCVGKYAYGTFIKAAIQFASFGGVAIAVILHADAVQAAAVYAAVNGVGTLAIWILLRRSIPWVRLGWQRARWSIVRELASAAFSFTGFPLGNALSLQGMLFVVNAVAGAGSVVLFGTTRTVARTGLQMLQLVNNAVWPELSAAYGSGDIDLTRRLHRRACQAAFLLSWTMVLAMAAGGPWLVSVWTRGKVLPSRTLLMLLLLAVVLNSLWMASSTLLAAINKHQRLAVYYLAGTSASLLLAIYLTRIWGVNGAAAALLLSELVMIQYVLPATLSLVGDTPRQFFLAMFQPVRGVGFQQIARSLGYRAAR